MNRETIPKLSRTVVLIGLMGAGKTTIGRRLAEALSCAFRDSDQEIEVASGRSVSDFFDEYGEEAFRAAERRTIERLLGLPPHILATGGGAFMDAATRAIIKEKAISVWLKAEHAVLMSRVLKRSNRPLLRAGDPAETMQKLMDLRYPVYAEADMIVLSEDGPHEAVVKRILDRLAECQTLPQ